MSMTKEQKEAIEILEGMVKSYIEADECGLSNNDFKHEIKAMQTVLNMLKEKDKEIDLLLDKLNQNYAAIFKNDEVKEIIEIYEKIKNISDLYGIKLRKECIKQYFERKVEN